MTPTLYIMIRDDMTSMTGGKAAAQASHAANDFEMTLAAMTNPAPWLTKAIAKWRADRSFGRALVLGCSERTMRAMIIDYTEINKYGSSRYSIFGHIVDPTYPVKDGEVTHLVEALTAAWLFTYDSAIAVRSNIDSDCDPYPTIQRKVPREYYLLNTVAGLDLLK